MATITIKPTAATDFQGSTQLSTTNHWIGRPSGYSAAFSVRYTFKSIKKLKAFTAKITGTLYGEPDGKFLYAISTSPSLPSSWKSAAADKSGITVAHSGQVAANTTYYLFISKDTSGNFVYYDDCAADNVTITGTVASGTVGVRKDGAWVKATPKVYKSGAWVDIMPKVYKNGAWVDTT
jgi:hypothetical protein